VLARGNASAQPAHEQRATALPHLGEPRGASMTQRNEGSPWLVGRSSSMRGRFVSFTRPSFRVDDR
jgi:hypothetical protein